MNHQARNVTSSFRNYILILAIAVTCNSFSTRLTFTRLPTKMNYVDTDTAVSDEKLHEAVDNVNMKKESGLTETITNNKKNILTSKETTLTKDAKKRNTGIFTPVVIIAKKIFGEKEIKKIRTDFISYHSNVITSFIKTSQSKLGKLALVSLFNIADENHDGVLDKDELKKGLNFLGFQWIGLKQADGILNRSDNNKDGSIDLEEFEKGAPKTLQTNLKKLAKKNGEEMGLLS